MNVSAQVTKMKILKGLIFACVRYRPVDLFNFIIDVGVGDDSREILSLMECSSDR